MTTEQEVYEYLGIDDATKIELAPVIASGGVTQELANRNRRDAEGKFVAKYGGKQIMVERGVYNGLAAKGATKVRA